MPHTNNTISLQASSILHATIELSALLLLLLLLLLPTTAEQNESQQQQQSLAETMALAALL